ncbi:MAG: hypothetical protein OHK93_000227 [Ramalina farinacea]|uniref:Uncharacterized protein n=1 Tax=Ramalina farinacea TaxID=258253 RepID=A0AA43QG78_9LECA|nr:hypothetical protein [Ramalina farinacea]
MCAVKLPPDVFLSTIKPLDKVVRAEDVQSCLYYIHVHSPDDDSILERTERDPDDHVLPPAPFQAVNPGGVAAIQRKPLPQQSIHPSIPASSISSSPMLGAKYDTHENRKSRILGPRPIKRSSQTPSPAFLEDMTNRQNTTGRLPTEPTHSTRSIDAYEMKIQQLERTYAANATVIQSCHSSDVNGIQDMTGHFPNNSVRMQTTPMDLGASLTIIRRYNGKQSNIGKVFSGTNLEVLNEGYLKYTSRHAQEGSTESSGRGDKPAYTPQNFQTVLMSTRQLHGPNRQSLHVSEAYTTKDTGMPLSEAGSQSQRFAFSTPWGGRCDFLTGIAGRSLKCRHEAYPGGQSFRMSELRFNLPSSQALRSPVKSKHAGERWERKRHSLPFRKSIDLGSPRPEIACSSEASSPVSDRELEAPPLDLSLGQEHAGGGFGGKQAKLGKLIIAPEGLQMLDLLVTANSAMWWKVYEKFW